MVVIIALGTMLALALLVLVTCWLSARWKAVHPPPVTHKRRGRRSVATQTQTQPPPNNPLLLPTVHSTAETGGPENHRVLVERKRPLFDPNPLAWNLADSFDDSSDRSCSTSCFKATPLTSLHAHDGTNNQRVDVAVSSLSFVVQSTSITMQDGNSVHREHPEEQPRLLWANGDGMGKRHCSAAPHNGDQRPRSAPTGDDVLLLRPNPFTWAQTSRRRRHSID